MERESDNHTDEQPLEGKPVLWIVVPCYNEEDVLPHTAPDFEGKILSLVDLGVISRKSRVCFVNDGSSDSTWNIIDELSQTHETIEGIELSRNRGHQNALLCGLMEARRFCDAAVSIDCDGQDDINAIDEMIERFLAGDDIVYGVRDNRESDTAFKRSTAQGFYKLLSRLGAETVYNHADYRLMSRQALDALAECEEVNLFLRGMVPLIGFPHSIVYYTRAERIAGESHYPMKKMVALAINGITSLSVKPIRIVSSMGLLFSILGFVGSIWGLVMYLLGMTVSGWASTIMAIFLIGGIQLLSLGVIGEYIGKIYLETKRRPRWLIRSRTWKPIERRFHG